MHISLQKRFGWRPRAVLVGLGVLGCCLLATLVHANVSSANVPTAGNNCQESGGKISGRGSTLQSVLQEVLAKAYRDDYCGTTGTEGKTGEAGSARWWPTTTRPLKQSKKGRDRARA